jgi:hypothetical protein
LRRALLLALAGLGLFAAAALMGFEAASRLAPSWLRIRAEKALTESLGRPVSIGSLRLSLRWGLALEGRDVAADPEGPEGPVLVARRAVARLDPVALLEGRIDLDRLLFEDAVLHPSRIRAAASPGAAEGRQEAGTRVDLADTAAALDALADGLRHLALPAEVVEARGLRIDLPEGAPGRTLLIESGRLGERWFERGLAVGAEAVLLGDRGTADGAGDDTREVGRIELVGSVGDAVEIEVHLQDLDLGLALSLGSGAAADPAGSEPAGIARGRLAWQALPGQPHRLQATALLTGLVLPLDRAAEPLRRERVNASAQLAVGAAEARLLGGRISDDRLVFDLEGRAALPLGRTARLRVSARVAEGADAEGLASLRELGLDLAGRRGGPVEEAFDRAESGQLRHAELELAAPLRSWPRLVASGLRGREREVRLGIEVADLRIRLDEDTRASAALGRLEWSGDVATLRLEAPRVGESGLPDLDVRLSGLDSLSPDDEFRCDRPEFPGALPGRGALMDWIRSRRKPGEPSAWQWALLEVDWIRHPSLGCSAERVRAEGRPAEGGMDWQLHEGVWAGMPVRGEIAYRGADESGPERVRIAAQLGPAWEAVGPFPAEGPWARGRFQVHVIRFGPWQTREAAGAFELRGDVLAAERAELHLDPAGELQGGAALDLGKEEEVHFRALLQASDVELLDLAAAAKISGEHIRGPLAGSASLEGPLRIGDPTLAHADGWLSLHSRGGSIRRRLPPLLAVAMAAEKLDLFAAPDTLEYEAIDAELRVVEGRARGEVVQLVSPSVRMMASGDMALTEPFALEAVMGVFLFPSLDSVIGRVPLLNRVLLGPDENLVNAYFALTGPWRDPDARLVPMKSLASGPASFVFEGLPAFVRGGIRRIQSVLPSGSETGAAGVARADS